MSGLVYKIARNFVEFSTEDFHSFKYYQPNQRQVLEISKAQGLEAVLEANEKLLRENLEVIQIDAKDNTKSLNDKEARAIKDTFIEQLLENSTLEDFFNAMNDEFIKLRGSKRKN